MLQRGLGTGRPARSTTPSPSDPVYVEFAPKPAKGGLKIRKQPKDFRAFFEGWSDDKRRRGAGHAR